MAERVRDTEQPRDIVVERMRDTEQLKEIERKKVVRIVLGLE